jgi:glycosyltransferase involved in cell wall biosynthesis
MRSSGPASGCGACNADCLKSVCTVLKTANTGPLKVLHLGKYFYPDLGGIESVVKDVVQGTASAGCDVTVLCLGRVGQLSEEYYYAAKVLRAPIWKIVASQPLGWRYFSEFIRQAPNFDIVQIHAPNMLAALALMMARVPGKVVVHWHADVVNHGWLGKLIQPLERLMLRRADAIVATSQAYADSSPLLRRFKDKVHIVPIGISDPRNDGVDRVVMPMAVLGQIPHGVPLILAVGRLVPYKGFDVLIDAARELPSDCRVVIAGGGEEYAKLESRIRENKVEDRVVLAGRLDDDTLKALFRRAAIFCLPSVSRAEAFGVVLLEAMAQGLPAVATDIAGSGVPWVNLHDATGLNVPVDDASALAAGLLQLLADPGQRAQMGYEARRRFENEFTSALATRRFIDLYGTLTGRAVSNAKL